MCVGYFFKLDKNKIAEYENTTSMRYGCEGLSTSTMLDLENRKSNTDDFADSDQERNKCLRVTVREGRPILRNQRSQNSITTSGYG